LVASRRDAILVENAIENSHLPHVTAAALQKKDLQDILNPAGLFFLSD
jgi:hypothetical protein